MLTPGPGPNITPDRTKETICGVTDGLALCKTDASHNVLSLNPPNFV